MNDNKKTNNLINMKYKNLFLVGVLLIAALFIFPILKQVEMFAPADTSTGRLIPTSISERICIENVWNESTAINFTVKNCGDFDLTVEEFSKTKYHINAIEVACTPDKITILGVNDVRNVTCPLGTYGQCTDGTCPVVTIKVTLPSGKSDAVTYLYGSN